MTSYAVVLSPIPAGTWVDERLSRDVAVAMIKTDGLALRLQRLDRLALGIFVGREKALERLRQAVDNAVSGHGGLVMLVGEVGLPQGDRDPRPARCRFR